MQQSFVVVCYNHTPYLGVSLRKKFHNGVLVIRPNSTIIAINPNLYANLIHNTSHNFLHVYMQVMAHAGLRHVPDADENQM